MRGKRPVVDRSLQAILRTLGDIGPTLESLSEPEQRIRHSLQLIRRIIPYDGCVLLEVRSERAADFRFISEPPQNGSPALKEALASSLALISLENIAALSNETAPRLAADLPWASYLGLPLVANDRIVGLLFLGSAEEESYDEQEIALLSIVSSSLASYLGLLHAHEMEHLAKRLFDSSLIGMTDTKGQYIVAANDAFLQMVGYTREDIERGSLDEKAMTPPEYADLDKKALRELEERGECTPYEKEYIRKDGSRVMTLNGAARTQEEPLRFVCFVMDLTERKRAEADLERLRSEFLSVVSHELKTPLTAIKGSAAMGLSAEPPSQTEARELFEVINEQAERLRELVGNLLDATRIEAGTLAVNPTPEDISDIVRTAVDTFGHAWQERPVQLSLPELPLVMADRRRIHQVVSNLLSNAMKASPGREPIVVTVAAEDGRAVVRVKDSGQGIPKDKLPLLFHKFSQVHESGGRGTGLGLVISKGIVAAHGGSIWAESDGEGRGATFSFTLPIVLPQDAQAG